jgi:hypothetical protein
MVSVVEEGPVAIGVGAGDGVVGALTGEDAVGVESATGPLGAGEATGLHPASAARNSKAMAVNVPANVRRRRSACLVIPSPFRERPLPLTRRIAPLYTNSFATAHLEQAWRGVGALNSHRL